jgi:hypothetical protein
MSVAECANFRERDCRRINADPIVSVDFSDLTEEEFRPRFKRPGFGTRLNRTLNLERETP